MSIKSDRWIRRMCLEHDMIDPFGEGQVRAGTISYGVSSYGYDMRVAPDFKIFTNALSAMVDPKAFDERSFVELTSDVCIVPPNSFALARSVEPWDAAALEGPYRALAEELAVKTGQLFGAVRVAITGRTAAPPLFDTMAVLGRDRCIARMGRAIEALGAAPAG